MQDDSIRCRIVMQVNGYTMERCPVNKNRSDWVRMTRLGKLKLLYDRFLEQYPTKLMKSVQNDDVSITNIEQIKK